MRKLISIKKIDYLGDYVLALTFSDDNYKEVDFKDFLFSSRNPMTAKYQDEKLFSSYSLDYGDLYWNEHELCFPVLDLYQGKI